MEYARTDYGRQISYITLVMRDKKNPSLVFSGDMKIEARGSTVPVGNEASPSFPLERWTRGLGFPGSTVHQ